uniref:C2H2-type domain-containing protein n=1 Tax=Esox lucius TaxID=8010 RepID=A0A6Q2ZLV5_ESOLU
MPEEHRTSRKEEQLQWLESGTKDFSFSPSCLKSNYDQTHNPTQSSHHDQIGSEENRQNVVQSSYLHQIESEEDGENPAQSSYLYQIQSHENRDKPWQCRVCDKCFSNIHHLKAHVRSHTGERPYKCPICRKCFMTTSALNRHQTIHAEGKQYSFCGKSFRYKLPFLNHVQSHAHVEDKERVCGICGALLGPGESMKAHLQTHVVDDTDPEFCQVCGKMFTTKLRLKKHMRVHTGEKPYRCEDCGRSPLSRLCLNLKKAEEIKTAMMMSKIGSGQMDANPIFLKPVPRSSQITHTLLTAAPTYSHLKQLKPAELK